MLKKILQPIIGVMTWLCCVLSSIFWLLLVYLVAALKFLPIKNLQTYLNKFIDDIPYYWFSCINLITSLTNNTKCDISGIDGLSTNDWYLMISNHRSWADIVVISKAFNGKISPVKFFAKKELLWQLPLAGFACQILGFPFMNRYSKEVLERKPQLKGKDIATTRKACEKFKNTPTTIINFVEGGRYSQKKHENQQSQYKHLLKPKAGGIAFVLATMGEYLHKIIDVTIVYPSDSTTLWDLLCGRISKITVNVEVLPIEKKLLGDYENDLEFRAFFQGWLNELWERKDKKISGVLSE